MRIIDILMNGMRIGAGDDDHVLLAAAGDEIAERVGILHPRTAPVEWNFSGIVGDATAGAEAGGVGMRTTEVVEPEGEVVLAGIVLGESELRPSHGTIEPALVFIGGQS